METPDATSAAAMNARITGSGTASDTFFAVAYEAAMALTPKTAATRNRTLPCMKWCEHTAVFVTNVAHNAVAQIRCTSMSLIMLIYVVTRTPPPTPTVPCNRPTATPSNRCSLSTHSASATPPAFSTRSSNCWQKLIHALPLSPRPISSTNCPLDEDDDSSGECAVVEDDASPLAAVFCPRPNQPLLVLVSAISSTFDATIGSSYFPSLPRLRYSNIPPRATSSSALPANASAAAPPGLSSETAPPKWSPSFVVSTSWSSPSFFFFMKAVGAHASNAPPHHRLNVFPDTFRASRWPIGVVHAPTAPIANAAGMSVTLFCVYAYDPAVVAQVTATTVVPTIFFAVIPSREHAGMNTTAPPKPVKALNAPAPVPHAVVAYCHPGFRGALTHAAGAALGAAPGKLGFTTKGLACAANPFVPCAPAPDTPCTAFAPARAQPTASFATRATISRPRREEWGGETTADGERSMAIPDSAGKQADDDPRKSLS